MNKFFQQISYLILFSTQFEGTEKKTLSYLIYILLWSFTSGLKPVMRFVFIDLNSEMKNFKPLDSIIMRSDQVL